MSIYRNGVVQVPTENGIDVYTKLILHGDGADNGTIITDEIGKTVTKFGNACTKIGTKKFGTASIFLDGSGDYLSLQDSDDWYLPTDWTIDFWINFPSLAGTQVLFAQDVNSNNRIVCYIDSGVLVFQTVNAGTFAYSISSALGFSVNTWYHIALGFKNGVYYLYINGVAKSNTVSGTFAKLNLSAPFIIGCELVSGTTPSYFANAYIDEFRLSKGIARWSANFTPPTVAYAVTTYTPTNANVSIKSQYRGLSGVNRVIKQQYRGFNGVNRLVFDKGNSLYDFGDECIEITGGWSSVAQTSLPYSSQGVLLNKESSNLLIEINTAGSTSASWFTLNAINLTNYTKLWVTRTLNTDTPDVSFHEYLIVSNNTPTSANATLGYTNLIENRTKGGITYSLDVAAVNGLRYVIFNTQVNINISTTQIFKIWLE